MRPVLAYLADGQVRRSRDVIEAMGNHFDLPNEERAEKIPSGQSRLANRVAWAMSYMAQAGLIDRPGRGLVTISDEGRSALQQLPERINAKALEAYPKFIEFLQRNKPGKRIGEPDSPTHEPFDEGESSTPSDLAERAERANRAAVESEVLASAMKLSPTGFEELVVRLLTRMGYGEAGSAFRTPPTNDKGIDGIISQDPLGLDRIYVQAKKYTSNPVDAPDIHAFAGALMSKQGDRGVFITTSRFTAGARAEADRIAKRIELIDGLRLAELLVQWGVGVQAEQSVILYRLDEDFFESL